MAGIGAAINTGGVGRGDTVAVFGCGGVGDAAIAGARLAGARDDHRRRHRRPEARVGQGHAAPRTRSTRKDADPVAGDPGRSPTGSASTSPSTPWAIPAVYEQAFYARDLAGTVVLVGVPTPTMTIELPLIEIFGRGGALKSSWYGDCLPSRDFPMLDRPVPAGPVRPRRVRLRDDRPRRRRGRRSRRCTTARCCARSWCSTSDRPASRRSSIVRRLQPRRAGLRRRQQRLARR